MITENQLYSILGNHLIFSVFQPIVSLKEKQIIGYEALARTSERHYGKSISPLDLFDAARFCGQELALDRLCRENHLNVYQTLPEKNQKILFVNFDPGILSESIVGCGWMDQRVRNRGIDPKYVAIEIVESKIQSQSLLNKFVNLYREFGFLIVLDDFGADYSNLNRIVSVRPDIIKIDRELIAGISTDYYKQSIISSIITLAKKIGALTLAEGVENVDDIMKCHELGTDLYQGFYFARPSTSLENLKVRCNSSISEASIKLSHFTHHLSKEQKNKSRVMKDLLTVMVIGLSSLNETQFDTFLKETTLQSMEIQCAYILDTYGIQISQTFCHEKYCSLDRRSLFEPSAKGENHSLKEYYYQLKNLNLEQYISEPYISLATGKLCRTISYVFKNVEEMAYILCIDLNQ